MIQCDACGAYSTDGVIACPKCYMPINSEGGKINMPINEFDRTKNEIAGLEFERKILGLIPDHPQQRQDSLLEQLIDLKDVANKLGMYDAADFIRNQIEQSRERR